MSVGAAAKRCRPKPGAAANRCRPEPRGQHTTAGNHHNRAPGRGAAPPRAVAQHLAPVADASCSSKSGRSCVCTNCAAACGNARLKTEYAYSLPQNQVCLAMANHSPNARLRIERRQFERSASEICTMCPFPIIKSAVWQGVLPDPVEESPSATIVVEVVRELLNCFDFSARHCFSILMHASINVFCLCTRS
jgi:hypothetical protein